MAEVTIGIVVAKLPPLRKSFDGNFKHVLPSAGSNKNLSRNKSGGAKFEPFNLTAYRGQTARTSGDGDSDKPILAEIEVEHKGHGPNVMKITQISIDRAI
jgi:hypothetical protein